MQYISADIAQSVQVWQLQWALFSYRREKGKRSALKHSRIMIHQPMGGSQGQASDIEITATGNQKLKKELYEIIAIHSGNLLKRLKRMLIGITG